MQGENFYVEAVLYGITASSYPWNPQLPMYEDKIYGRLPNDYSHQWFLGKTEKSYSAYPSIVPYVFQVSSIATNSILIIALAIMSWISERIKAWLGTQYGFYFLVIVFIILFFLLVFLLNALLF